MRTLTRYILREVLTHALIGTAIFTFVIFTGDLGKILELVVRNSAPLPSVGQVFLFTLPVAFTYTVPMGVLVGILIGLGRLAADSEITAMRASGIGIWTFLRMLSIFVLAGWLLALANSVYIAPKALAALGRLQDRLKASQVSFEVRPRVFYEGFPKLVLYVEDVKSAQRAAIWKNVFIADISNPAAPRITIAQQGILVSEGPDRLHLHLSNGSQHETDPRHPEHYQISTFEQTDLPIIIPTAENKGEDEPIPVSEVSTWDLATRAGKSGDLPTRWYQIELQRRFALPSACIVLALVGVPLGLSSKKGGKSTGFVLTIALVFAFYSVSLIGVSLARQGKVSPALGVWSSDIVFLMGGALLLWLAERKPLDIGALSIWKKRSAKGPAERARAAFRKARITEVFERTRNGDRVSRCRFPTLLDDYVLRDFVVYLVIVLAAFIALLLVFTLFELLGDILRNSISPVVVGEYLLNVTPFFLYKIAPLSVLLAVLITFGLLQRSNEITAMKATGTSIYRIVIPIFIVSGMLALALFFSEQSYLPYTNKRQDALRSQIKGKPAQTYLNPDRKWIFGQHSNIYYYQFFDSERDQFANLSEFQFDPATFRLTQRLYAEKAHWESGLDRWVCTQGWARELRDTAIQSFRTFDVATFPEVSEAPTYFKKEVKQSSEMNYDELRRYIHDLQQSGFDVVRLRVQLQMKLAFPVIALVMAVLAVPFSLSAGRRGAITGVATAVGIALAYTVISNLFEAMGNINQLPPVLAAWSPDLIFGLLGGYMVLKVPT